MDTTSREIPPPVLERSAVLRARSTELQLASRQHRTTSTDLRRQAGLLRATRRPSGSPLNAFALHGSIDDRPCSARWERGRLVCDEELRRRAEILIDLGERFGPATGRQIDASVDGEAIAVLLTCIRACSTVDSVEVDWS